MSPINQKTYQTNQETNPNQNQSTLEFIFLLDSVLQLFQLFFGLFARLKRQLWLQGEGENPVKTRCERAFLQPPTHSIGGSIPMNP